MNLESRPEFALDSLRVEFSSPETERDFQLHHLDRSRASLRITLSFCSLFYIAFALTDVAALGYSSEALLLLFARMLVAVTAMTCLYVIRVRPESVAGLQLAATAAEIVGMATFMLVVWLRPAEIPWHAMSLCIMLIVVYVFIPNRLVIATSIAFATTAIFVMIAMDLRRLTPSDVVTMSMLLLLANSFGLVAARRYQRLWRDEYRALTDLQNLSIRDHLTGCYNRRHLHDTLLSREITSARRHNLQLALILCDIDHFKSINDTYGHHGGDAALRHISAMLQTMTRRHVDSVVRYGGEEFLLVLSHTDLDGAVCLAERLRAAIADNPTVDAAGRSIAATASFGVLAVNFAVSGKNVTEQSLVNAADALLYEAKKSGRNNIQWGEWSDESPVRSMGTPVLTTYPATGTI